jgi:hypothetical protein
LPEHWFEPGTHTPVHAPVTHAKVQAEAAPHCPLPLHVCTPLPEHSTALGAQTPVQAPETHAEFEQDVGFCH